MSKRLIALVFGALAVGLIAGCGSSGGDDSTTPLTKAEFIKQADALCTAKVEQISSEYGAYVKEHGIGIKDNEAAPVQIATAEKVILPGYREQAEELRDLDPPKGDEATINKMLDTFEEGIEEAKKDPLGTAEAGSPNFKKSDKMAADYGLKICTIS